VRGDTLVILRRGRLFTVSLAGGSMSPIDSINAFPPGVSGRGDWYDEMLISGDRVIVVGYSYARGGTEINRFRLDPAGRLRFEDAWHLRSNDYYSSRNYASRLIGNRLVFYTPLDLDWDENPFEVLPGVRRWQGGQGAQDRKFKRIASARQVFIAPAMRRSPDAVVDTLHSVTSCDLTAADLGCSATAVLGPRSRTFYVSAQGVYLWVTDAWQSDRPESYLYRLPFGGERPSATAARGAPVDQFSFREDPAEGIVNVLVRSDGGGDAMFAPEAGGNAGVALLRVRFSDFGDASRQVPRARYRFLPSVPGWSFHNRFAGDYVLYGAGTHGESAERSRLVAARLRDGRATQLPLPHSVDRIELLGRDAMVIGGTPRGLGFSTVELDGRAPDLGDRYIHPDSAEGESRSHAFFFSPDPDSPGGDSGTVGPAGGQARRPRARALLRKLGGDGVPSAGAAPPGAGRRAGGADPGDRRRLLPGELRRLVRQCPADLPGRPNLRPARLRAGRGRARPRPDARGGAGQLRAAAGAAVTVIPAQAGTSRQEVSAGRHEVPAFAGMRGSAAWREGCAGMTGGLPLSSSCP
jgi:hypothetical protein